MAVLTSAFLTFKLSRILRDTNGRDGSPIKNDYSFLINRNSMPPKASAKKSQAKEVTVVAPKYVIFL